MRSDRWLLPEGVPEVLPPDSWRLEAARRVLLDLYHRWGFDLIRPPLIEYLDSLLTGAGHNLDLQTFKLTDQISGRMLGVRSDITTQAARIDAHRMPVDGPARYCYTGSVLHTRPEEVGGTRVPLQIGVELFGHDGISSDFEVLSLMLETLHAMRIPDTCLDLGHVAIYRALVALAGIDADTEQRLFDIMQRKSAPDLAVLAEQGELDADTADWFAQLMTLNGDIGVLARARQAFADLDPRIDDALQTLADVAARLERHYPRIPVSIDLAELRGYRYKTGMVFAAYAPGLGREIARGGRYDNVGSAFGRARPATGFSADLNALAKLGSFTGEQAESAIFAPAGDNQALHEAIRQLRSTGRRVIQALPGQSSTARDLGCGQQLIAHEGQWVCRDVVS